MPRKKSYSKKNKNYLILGIAIFLLAVVALAVFFNEKSSRAPLKERIVVPEEVSLEEDLVIPDTKSISENDSRVLAGNLAGISLSPGDNEKVIVPKTVLTMKTAYDLATAEAAEWDSAAKLSFIKSLGTITVDGQSSQWQLVFGAESKDGKAYEIIIRKDKIVSQKEIDSTTGVAGVDLPAVWPDSGEFVKRLQKDPNFSGASINSFLLGSTPESTDAKWWFSVGTSKGVATFEIK
jgi:hypothetical protein